MTEAWKVVRDTEAGLRSAIVSPSPWGRLYEKGQATQFCKSAPGLAFDNLKDAQDFREMHEGAFPVLQVWKAKADALPFPVRSILPFNYVKSTKSVTTFWKSNRWQLCGDSYVDSFHYIPV